MSAIYPVIVMVFWTFTMALLVLFTRISSVKNGIVTMEYYQIFQGGEPPDAVIKTTRHLANLFEAPVLFYLICVLIIVLQIQSTLLVQLAWGYVVVRILHSLIHLSYNKVEHRLGLFLMSQVILVVMWIILLINLLS